MLVDFSSSCHRFLLTLLLTACATSAASALWIAQELSTVVRTRARPLINANSSPSISLFVPLSSKKLNKSKKTMMLLQQLRRATLFTGTVLIADRDRQLQLTASSPICSLDPVLISSNTAPSFLTDLVTRVSWRLFGSNENNIISGRGAGGGEHVDATNRLAAVIMFFGFKNQNGDALCTWPSSIWPHWEQYTWRGWRHFIDAFLLDDGVL